MGGTSKDHVDRALLDAVVGIGTDLDLSSTLDRIVTAACELVEARYGALGVVGLAAGHRQSGLRNLRERAQILGGTVLLQSNQPQGTVLELRAPLGSGRV